ncbi:MAG: hypothetical protein JNM28_03640 [Armatimonadetes bacterium]|nr:hypothetical protein [Armatimonadota bacterium]
MKSQRGRQKKGLNNVFGLMANRAGKSPNFLQVLFVSAFLCFTALGQATFHENHPVYWIVATQQAQTKGLADVTSDATVEQVREQLNIDCMKMQLEDATIFVSDMAIPIESYEKSIRWLAKVDGSSRMKFDLGSPEGRELKEFLDSKFFFDKFDVQPGTKPIGLTMGIELVDPSYAGKGNFIWKPEPERNSDLALATPFSGGIDRVKEHADAISGRSYLFPTTRSTVGLTFLKFYSGMPESLHSLDLANLAKVVSDLGTRLAELESVYKQSFEFAVKKFGVASIGDFEKLKEGDYSLESLPAEIREKYIYTFVSGWESRGFASKEEAQTYMSSNPTLKFQFTLIAYQECKQVGYGDQPFGFAFIIKP